MMKRKVPHRVCVSHVLNEQVEMHCISISVMTQTLIIVGSALLLLPVKYGRNLDLSVQLRSELEIFGSCNIQIHVLKLSF